MRPRMNLLEQAGGTVRTPRGEISAGWDLSGDRYPPRLTVSLPAHVPGRIILPYPWVEAGTERNELRLPDGGDGQWPLAENPRAAPYIRM